MDNQIKKKKNWVFCKGLLVESNHGSKSALVMASATEAAGDLKDLTGPFGKETHWHTKEKHA